MGEIAALIGPIVFIVPEQLVNVTSLVCLPALVIMFLFKLFGSFH